MEKFVRQGGQQDLTFDATLTGYQVLPTLILQAQLLVRGPKAVVQPSPLVNVSCWHCRDYSAIGLLNTMGLTPPQ